MKFPQPLIPATLMRRYKRFLADVKMADGSFATVHCANPGSMLSLAVAGRRVWLSHHPGTKRKLAYAWELEEAPTGCIGINTACANPVVAEALAAGRIPELTPWPVHRREVSDGAESRLDFHLSGADGPDGWLEVKSVSMSRRPGLAEWPDARSARGAKHLEALVRLAEAGAKSTLLFLAQRSDCAAFGIAGDIDPAYARALAAIDPAKVRILAYDCAVSPDGIELRKPLTIQWN